MRSKPIKLKKPFELWNSVWFDRDFIKKSASKVYYYMYLAVDNDVLLSFKTKPSQKNWREWKFY